MEYTFATTGITIQVRPFSPVLAIDLQRGFPKPPSPPLNKVETGPGIFREIENVSDPAHLSRMNDYYDDIQRRTNRVYIELAVECEVDTKIVERIRQVAIDNGSVLEGSDKYIYIAHYAAGKYEEWNDLVRIIDGKKEVSKDAVEAASSAFSGDVPPPSDTPVGDTSEPSGI